MRREWRGALNDGIVSLAPRWLLLWLLALVSALLFPVVASAQQPPATHAEAQEIARTLKCPVCES